MATFTHRVRLHVNPDLSGEHWVHIAANLLASTGGHGSGVIAKNAANEDCSSRDGGIPWETDVVEALENGS